MWKIIIIFIYFCAFRSNGISKFDIRNSNELLEETKETLKAINNTLNYFKRQPNAIGKDVIFGVVLGRANLKWIIHRLKASYISNYHWIQEGYNLIKKCNDIIRSAKSSWTVFKQQLWTMTAKDLVSGALRKVSFEMPKLDTCTKINEYMLDGTPEYSDICISELFSSNCKVSDFCWNYEINHDFHSGYVTSHKLLYLQFAEQLPDERKQHSKLPQATAILYLLPFDIAYLLKCDKTYPEKFLNMKKERKLLCQQMLEEAKALHNQKLFNLTRDLFMEQVALCGLEGFEEFSENVWRKEILSWQNHNGCFGYGMDFNCPEGGSSSHRRVKRRDYVIDGCHTHVTAVGLSSMTFHLRYLLNKSRGLKDPWVNQNLIGLHF